MYKLSNLAAEDFGNIYVYTLQNFGVTQADNYTLGMESCLSTLISFPLMGRDCPEITDGIRRFDHQHHAIFYRVRPQDIFIIRILHHQMDPLIHMTDF